MPISKPVSRVGIAFSNSKRYMGQDYTLQAGFSLRKINPNYNGPCLRLRRSSDNVEFDVGFDGGDLIDFTDIYNNINYQDDAFVVTWYDQSENKYDVTRTTLNSQPRFVYQGNIDTQNGLPSIYFNGGSQYLRRNTITNFTNCFCSFVCNYLGTTTQTNFRPISFDNNLNTSNSCRVAKQSSSFNFYVSDGQTSASYNFLSNTLPRTTISVGFQFGNADTTKNKIYYDGIIIDAPNLTSSPSGIIIGSSTSISHNGYVSEVALYTGVPNENSFDIVNDAKEYWRTNVNFT